MPQSLGKVLTGEEQPAESLLRQGDGLGIGGLLRKLEQLFESALRCVIVACSHLGTS